ncbi:MAG: hypothetical protein D6782_07375, partial [Alphaproteobacteria bacterium]
SLAAIARITPWRFQAALAPDMAAAREGRRLRLADVLAACRTAMAAGPELLLIEGAGGVMSPLAEDATGLDVMVQLRVPALLVSGTYLGAISHALTALEALRAHHVPVTALVLSESVDGVDLAATAARLQRCHAALPIAAVPRLAADKAMDHPAIKALAALLVP